MEPLVPVDWLAEHVGEPDVRVFDVTVQVSRVWMVPPKHTLTAPTPEHFAAAVGAAGLGSEHRVVLYDRRESMWAARMW